MTDRACATCQFFDHEKDGEGTCRANPPRRDDNWLSGFPPVRDDWWCGRWSQEPGAPRQIYQGEATSIRIRFDGSLIPLEIRRGQIVTITVHNPKAEDDEHDDEPEMGLGALFG